MLALMLTFVLLPVSTGGLAAESGRPATAHAGVGASPAVGGDVKRTRFVVALETAAEFQVFALDNPNRVVVDVKSADVRLPQRPRSGGVGLVSDFTAGRTGKSSTRVVIAVTEPVIVEKATIETIGATRQLFLEIVPAHGALQKAIAHRPGSFEPPIGLGAGDVAPPLPKPAESPAHLNARNAKPVVVIDPGHGGQDSGAQKNGIVEKETVLAFALVLREKLEATGRYKVLMTRETDTFISLDGRREFAEKHKANLFIAVHADYAKSNARGATIYALRPSVAEKLKNAAREAAAEVSVSEKKIAPVDNGDRGIVSDILSDLARADVEATTARTNLFQRSIIAYMGNSTNLRNDPDKTAAFKVLKTALFPSVLIELAYVTNKEDAALLGSRSWREKVSASIATAVDNYFSHKGSRLPMLAGLE
ncbi:MAG: N-acetylmuramoyl-L-alanine amidase [Hyphomicrobiaceae bacterium]|nr:N-acetylmuramoyl-L-alanine amidase [Hyphomicrobiaceae bacterium]